MLFKKRFFGNGSTSRGLSNVLISDILFGGKPREILRHGSSGKITNVSVPQRSCVRDEGRPLAIGLQEQVANHRKRLGSKAPVVSVTGKGTI